FLNPNWAVLADFNRAWVAQFADRGQAAESRRQSLGSSSSDRSSASGDGEGSSVYSPGQDSSSDTQGLAPRGNPIVLRPASNLGSPAERPSRGERPVETGHINVSPCFRAADGVHMAFVYAYVIQEIADDMNAQPDNYKLRHATRLESGSICA
ncbi:hypothetical protein GGF43_005683, partial [Coemansia sp. RSA 2618]